MKWRAVVLALGWLVLGIAARAEEPDDRQVRQADQALFLALTKHDGAAIERLLEPRFSWTTTDGATLTGSDVVKAPPATGAQVGANLKLQLYGRVAVVTSTLDHSYVLRVWTKSRRGWRALVYHEVTVGDPPGGAAPAVTDCENPCRSVPFKPRNGAERGVIESWQALESAVVKGDGAAWAPHVADAFTVVSNYRVQDKSARIAAINKGGTTPPPLVSATMGDYGDTVVMSALHQPAAGKPIRVSRVWIKHNGTWQMAISYQTIIQAEPAKTG